MPHLLPAFPFFLDGISRSSRSRFFLRFLLPPDEKSTPNGSERSILTHHILKRFDWKKKSFCIIDMSQVINFTKKKRKKEGNLQILRCHNVRHQVIIGRVVNLLSLNNLCCHPDRVNWSLGIMPCMLPLIQTSVSQRGNVLNQIGGTILTCITFGIF